ncbi:MAG: VOC family protein [Cyclobacteriaceae bacterium]|nr:VOC family protein [Cyclobacteriaceae bacterium]
MDNTTNSLNWFEIPAIDIDRSKKFYEAIFGIEMEDNAMEGAKMAFFPWAQGSGKATGALVQGENHKPSMEGTIVYLNANPSMDNVIDKVEEEGGKVLVPKMSIGEHGHIAFIMDTEGNNIGIHSIE